MHTTNQSGSRDPRLDTPIDELLADLSFRTPVISDPELGIKRDDFTSLGEYFVALDEYNHRAQGEQAQIERQWLMLSELARRAIIETPEARAAAMEFAAAPVNEQLASESMRCILGADSQATHRHLAKAGIMDLLGLPAVPDSVIVPDLRLAPKLLTHSVEAKSLARDQQRHPEYFGSLLEATIERLKQSPGISNAERVLIAQRYRYGRDVKLLALQAELLENPIPQPYGQTDKIEHLLPSGIKIVVSAGDVEKLVGLLDPATWQGRRQIKDRVHEVRLDGQAYILKERKTNRHIDTNKNTGHRDGATAVEEFETSRHLLRYGTLDTKDIRITWEKALASVVYPDGFQFCVFDKVVGLLDTAPVEALTHRILDVPQAYQDEYKIIGDAAKQLYKSRPDLLLRYPPLETPKRLAISRAARAYKKTYLQAIAPDELTFEEFARIKAGHVVKDAWDAHNRAMATAGVFDTDGGGDLGYRIVGDDRPVLELTGLDFEYCSRSSDELARYNRREAENLANGNTLMMKRYDVADTRAITLAASYAMAELDGCRLPAPGVVQ